jgi:SAM-dependent methyltransferase
MGLASKLARLLPSRSATSTPTQLPAAPPAQVSYASPAERIRATGVFSVDDIGLLADTHRAYDFAPGSPWDHFKDSFLVLPDWYRIGLDPMSNEYEDEQRKLWGVLAGVDHAYDPLRHEKEAPLVDVDAVRFPSHFVRRDPQAVEHMSEHILASGMIMKNSGLQPGQWAMEYGAGFGQTALQLARLGVNVDTVDISEEFCRHVKTQADFYGVPLTPFQGRFGFNPRGEKKYDLIFFYESFHHCLEFKQVVHRIREHLAPKGRVILAGEPIPLREDKHVPYPWGLRLHSEVVAVIRVRHWFELGFSEDFVADLFTHAGFAAEKMECPVSPWGSGYIFRHRRNRIEMGKHWLPIVASETWHGAEAQGRWTKERSVLPLDMTDSFDEIQVDAVNHHPKPQVLDLHYGDVTVTRTFQPGQRLAIRIDASRKVPNLVLTSKTLTPAKHYGKLRVADDRALGVFVTEVSYWPSPGRRT